MAMEDVMLRIEDLEYRAGVGRDFIRAAARRAHKAVDRLRIDRIDGEADRRLMSQREMGELLKKNVSTVSRVMEKLGIEPDDPNKKYAYSMADFLRVREALGLMPARFKRPVVIACSNFKGGVSKSTISAHLSWAFALAGYRTCAIDLDPQGTLSAFFGRNPSWGREEDTILPWLLHDGAGPSAEGAQPSLDYALRQVDLPTLSVIEANMTLNAVERLTAAYLSNRGKEAKAKGREPDYFVNETLKKGINQFAGKFDVVVIDTPPSLGALTAMGVLGADVLMVPLRPEGPDFASSVQFLNMLSDEMEQWDYLMSKAGRAEQIRFATMRLVLTQTRTGDDTEEKLAGTIRDTYGSLMASATFPHSAAVEHAATKFRTVYDASGSLVERRYAQKARMALGELVDEVMLMTEKTSGWVERRGGAEQ